MSLKRKVCIVKVLGFSEEDQTVDAIVTTEDIDRDGEICLADGLDIANFANNPILLWGHEWEGPPKTCLGHAVEWQKIGKTWRFKFWYDCQNNPDARLVFGLICSKSLRAYSVGFLPRKTVTLKSPEEDVMALPQDVRAKLLSGACKSVFAKWELIEVSNCLIGNNPNALKLSWLKKSGISLGLAEFIREEMSMKPKAVTKAAVVEESEEESTEKPEETEAPKAAEAECSASAVDKSGIQSARKKGYYYFSGMHPTIADVVARLGAQAEALPSLVDPDYDGDIDNVEGITSTIAVLQSVIAQLETLSASGTTKSVVKKVTKAGRVQSQDSLEALGKSMGYAEDGVRKCMKAMRHVDSLITLAGGDSQMPDDFPDDPEYDDQAGCEDDDVSDSIEESVKPKAITEEHDPFERLVKMMVRA